MLLGLYSKLLMIFIYTKCIKAEFKMKKLAKTLEDSTLMGVAILKFNYVLLSLPSFPLLCFEKVLAIIISIIIIIIIIIVLARWAVNIIF